MMNRVTDIQKGTFVFVGSHSLSSQVVRRAQGFHLSHVCYAVSAETLIEAEWNGVIRSSVYKYIDGPYWMETIKMKESPEFIDEYTNGVLSYLGKPYDWSQLFGLFFYRVLHSPRSVVGTFDSPSRFICSEVCIRRFQEMGKEFTKPVYDYSVKDLYQYLGECYG